ncbi:MAG: NAD+ synthase [Sphingomonadales bacterium]|nr:NAD+ synthase [Sphingomonadales bacterium]MBM3923961.1 NAD+ synthase [Sphingomonadales bacterium]
MRLGLVQFAPRIGEVQFNADSMLEAANAAAEYGATLAVFPELSLIGYPPMDLLRDETLRETCRIALDEMANRLKIPALMGAPSWEDGKVYNAAYWVSDQGWSVVGRKVLLPNYDVFDESRYFQSGDQCSVLEHDGKKFLLSICEDLWARDADVKYPTDPVQLALGAADSSVDFILNMAASPYSIQGIPRRAHVLQSTANRCGIPVVYVNQVGARADLIFDGGTSVAYPNKAVQELCPKFEQGVALWDTDSNQHLENFIWDSLRNDSRMNRDLLNPPHGSNAIILGDHFDSNEITKALCLGIRDYLAMTSGKKVVIGLSGGVDSAVVLCLAVMALGSENVTALLMPSGYSSERSVADSVALCRIHEVAYQILSIEDSFSAVMGTLQTKWETQPTGLTEENIQPRLRALFLMAYSNQYGAMWLNSSNKSEAAVGYSTLYGDMGGGLSVIGDLYKTQVYALANCWNAHKEWIPSSILESAPSAELRPGQLDSDSLPPYPLLDAILMDRIEGSLDEEGLILNGHDPDLVRRVMDMMKRSEFKRHQMPPVLRVSSRSFGRGWRRSLV